MLDENTLDKCGYTVADLINYLSKFPADAEFDVGFNDGADTPITKWAEKAQEAIETSKAELLQLTTP